MYSNPSLLHTICNRLFFPSNGGHRAHIINDLWKQPRNPCPYSQPHSTDPQDCCPVSLAKLPVGTLALPTQRRHHLPSLSSPCFSWTPRDADTGNHFYSRLRGQSASMGAPPTTVLSSSLRTALADHCTFTLVHPLHLGPCLHIFCH